MKLINKENDQKLRTQLVNNEELTNQINKINFDFEALQTQHQGALTHIDLFKQKNEDDSEILRKQQILLESLKPILDNCINQISLFSAHFDRANSQQSQIKNNASRRFKDLMLLFMNIEPIPDLAGLEESAKKIFDVLKACFDEIEQNNKLIGTLKSESGILAQKLEMEQRKITNLETDLNTSKDRERMIKTEVDVIRDQLRKLEKERDLCNQREDLLEQEKKEVILENARLLKEQEKYRAQIRMLSGTQEKLSLEMKHRSLAYDKDASAIHNLEEKIQQLTSEKRDLENISARLAKALPSTEMKKVASEIIKTTTEMWLAVREKAKLEIIATNTENTLRGNVESSGLEENTINKGTKMRYDIEKVRNEMTVSDGQIEKLKKRLLNLEDELKSLELDEQQKSALLNDSKKHIAAQSREVADLERENSLLRDRIAELEDAYNKLLGEKSAQDKILLSNREFAMKSDYLNPERKYMEKSEKFQQKNDLEQGFFNAG